MLTMAFSVISSCSMAAMGVQTMFNEQRIARHSKAKREIDHPGESEARKQRRRRRPDRVGERCPQLPKQVEQRDDRDQRSILEQRDEAVDETRNDMAQRLRHYDQRRGLPP